jgi:hypothetical protein
VSFAYRLRVCSDGRELKRGTAWFVRAELVVTAFHVVSDDAGAWLHEHDPTVQYRLELADPEAVVLQSVTEDKAADIALLRLESPGREVSVLELAADEAVRAGMDWDTVGYPRFHPGGFGIGGTVTTLHGGSPATAFQLLFNEGTTVEWDGISGSPVRVGGSVAGIITQVTYGANTGWAAPVSALRVLLKAIPEAKPLLTPSQTEWVRTILQELANPDLPGIALLEPLNFGARYVVEQVIAKLQQVGGPTLVIRLVPNPNTTDERRLYSALCRDVRHGLEAALGRPLPVDWQSGFGLSSGADPCAHLDGEGFELLLTGLLEGPVSRSQRYLLLSVEGLSRIAEEHLKNWAWLMSRLLGSYPLKLLVWGGRELHELCSGAKSVEGFSPFQRLKQRRVPPFSVSEVTELVTRQLGQPTGAVALYELTRGHPALVNELLEQATVELGGNNVSGLRSRALASAHLRGIKKRLEDNPEALDVLRRLLHDDRDRRWTEAEDRLYWLGVLQEDGPAAWRWAAPILEQWARQWLG